MSACTCGRSPTDNCVGWHNLTEDKYLAYYFFEVFFSPIQTKSYGDQISNATLPNITPSNPINSPI